MLKGIKTKPKIEADRIPDSVRTSQAFQLPRFEIPPEGLPFRKVIKEVKSMLISRALEAAGGVQKRAAELLQIKPTTLNDMIKRYGMQRRRSRPAAASLATSPPAVRRSGHYG